MKSDRLNFKYSHVASIVCFFLVIALPVQAADYFVTPLALNLDVNKRDIVQEYITLTNNTDRQVRVYASVNEVSADSNGVVKSFQAPSDVDRTDTPTSWIEISRGRIELKPQEVREIPFTVRMNPNTKPGDYSVFIGFATASNQPQAHAKVMSGDAPGVIVNLSVDQEQNIFLHLKRFVVDRFVTEENGGALYYTLSNPTRVDVVPKGEVIFYDNSGDEVGSVPLNVSDIAVPAEGEQGYSLQVPSDFGIGKYKAFLSVEYGEHLTAAVHDTAFFYIVPIKQLIAAFLILMILSVFVALYVHRRYDMALEGVIEYDSVPMYVREGRSEDQHHDIDLKQKNDS